MTKVGAFDAKTHFSELLERAGRGERILITKRGKPAAILMPPEQQGFLSPEEAVCRVREIRKGTSLGDLTIRELIDEGRRP